MKSAYIIDGIRTPVGNFGGVLAHVRADDLAAIVLKELVRRNPSIKQKEIAEVILGCANQAGEDNRNVARMALLLAGLPYTISGETVNRLCASGLSACVAAARSINVGDADLVIAGGVENMTRGPWVLSKASAPFGRDVQLHDSSFGWRFINPKMKELYGVDAMGETAENLAERDRISREDQDLFSVWSQQKAAAAQASGRFDMEIIPVNIPQKKGEALLFANDEFLKPATNQESLAKLKPSFRKEGGTVTAGNSSGLNDGAAAVLFASETAIEKFKLQALARIVSSASAGVEPRFMGIGPVEAANKAIAKAGISFEDIDVIELNEAFAAQALACIRAWGLKDNDPRINPNGGAIAIGHPLGMSGARILYSAALELKEKNKRYALVTMCIGVGQGYAVVLEKC
jgi:acetyl-CoA acyltransferase